jgi:hypothetical protein
MQSAGFRPSMSRKGDWYDNAPMESFFHTLKTELVYQRHYATRAEATREAVYVVKVRLKAKPPVTSMAWALYVGDERVSKYWEYKDGIYFVVFDPQFFVTHKGKRLCFSQNDTDFFDTDAELAPAPSESNAIKLPPQADVLNRVGLRGVLPVGLSSDLSKPESTFAFGCPAQEHGCADALSFRRACGLGCIV